MLQDHYGLSLSTGSAAARDAYVQGAEAKLTAQPGAIEAFDRAIAADPVFALPHAARAHALLERGDGPAALQAMAAAETLGKNVTAREASHVAYFGHLSYEEGDPDAARDFLVAWLPCYPREGALYSHLSWHLALAHLEAGDTEAASRLFREAFAPEVHTGPPRGKLNDGISYLWRRELAGQPRDAAAWRAMHVFMNAAFPRAGAAFSDMHVALAQVVGADNAALENRVREIDALVQAERYPSGPLVPAVARGFAAFERGDFAAAICALEPVAGELERIGGSHAQLDLVRFTLARAFSGARQPEMARRILGSRRRDGQRVKVPKACPA